MAPQRRVVVAGAGFAGVGVARALEDACDVTVIAPGKDFVFLPLLHEVLSGRVEPVEVTRPLAELLPGSRLLRGRAERVEGSELVTAAGERLPFDALVVAVGAEVHGFGVPGALEHGLPFYSLGDAVRGQAELRVAAERALAEGRPARVRVVGASFTGVEVAGEAADLLDGLGARREVTLLDAVEGIFPAQSERFREGLRQGLARRGLELRSGQPVTAVEPGQVRARRSGREEVLPSDVTFWCAGVKPRRLEGVDPRVDPTLRCLDRRDVLVVGDAAQFPRELDVPRLAQTAEQQVPVAAHNVLHPDRPRAYTPDVKGLIVSVGGGYAVAELAGGFVFAGVVPWHVKRQLYKAKIALAATA